MDSNELKNKTTVEVDADNNEEIIVVPKEARTPVQDDEIEEVNEPTDEHIFIRRVIIAPMSGFINMLNRENIEVPPPIEELHKHLQIQQLIGEHIKSAMNEAVNIKNSNARNTNETNNANNNDTHIHVKKRLHRNVNKKTSNPTISSTNESNVRKNNTSISGGKVSKAKSNNNFTNKLCSQILAKCYMYLTIILVLISMTSYISYKLVREITVYKRIKTAISA